MARCGTGKGCNALLDATLGALTLQAPLQRVQPLGQVQAPLTQVCPEGHTLPQVPQLLLSVVRSCAAENQHKQSTACHTPSTSPGLSEQGRFATARYMHQGGAVHRWLRKGGTHLAYPTAIGLALWADAFAVDACLSREANLAAGAAVHVVCCDVLPVWKRGRQK